MEMLSYIKSSSTGGNMGEGSLSLSVELFIYLHGILCCEGACKVGIHQSPPVVFPRPVHSATSFSCFFDSDSFRNQGSKPTA